MNNINVLIKKFCSEKIKYIEMSEIFKIVRGKRLTTKELKEDGKYAVFHGGLEPLGYYQEYNRIGDTVMIINVGASAGTVAYSKDNFWSSDGCYCIEHNEKYINRFLYHYLKNQETYFIKKVRKAGIPTLDSKIIEKLLIPVVPIEIQKSIVYILDKFEQLVEKKEKELTLREKQYLYISSKLLINNKFYQFKIQDICKITKGKTPIQKASPGEYPLVVTTSERKTCDTYQFDTEAVCIPLVSSRGHGIASLNHVYYQDGKFALGNILCALEVDNKKIILPKYLYYFLENTKDYTLVPLMKGGANVSLHINNIYDVEVLAPSLDEQYKIINKLDTLNAYHNKLEDEIQMRKNQLAYYRNKLLSFEELSVSE